MTASLRGLCVAQLGKSKATEVESIKIASVSCLSSLSHAFNFFPPSPILPCTGIFHLNSPPSLFRWKSIPLPPLPALLPPHIWSPLHSLVLSLGSRMGGGGGLEEVKAKWLGQCFLTTSCTLKINGSTILTLCANFCNMLLLNPFCTQR